MSVGDLLARAMKESSRKKCLFPQDETWCVNCCKYVRKGRYCPDCKAVIE